ncbi:MAG: TIGR03960 family B12-binding radical SAM protein [Planctomycetes bacterium]|nr:TIGR03960 family B12-binding radical SAM protein [Planctomycetota bacterium]
MTSNLAERVSNELLPRIRQPAQYIGGEVNQLVQPADWDTAEIRVVIAFPDTYRIGMSHLGCQILYWLCNHTPGVCAERTFCPWIDAEQVMRRRRIPLFTWDTRRPVREADILAISLQYELCFTSVLNLLDLAGVPLRAADRSDRDPLVLAGGPQADNPEPLAEFLDLVVVGDGEDALAQLLAACREYKRAGVGRRELILLLARRFPWAYAPNLYDATYHADGTLAGLLPTVDGLPAQIERCHTADFEHAPFPARPLVPWVEAVHDRIALEIMRGCPQACRFCHAGYTKRPLKVRSVDRIMELADEAQRATGHREIGLLSLSTADYPHLGELAERVNSQFGPRMVNISLPSLRVDRMLREIPWLANQVRKAGLTIAVEAADDNMRRAIRKKVTDGNLLDGVRAAYEAGWKRVKLYFMAGFPGERDEDIRGIWELSQVVSKARQDVGKPPAHVTASVGWLVPKPFTPLQWMAQPRLEYFLQVRDRLRGLAHGRRSAVRLRTHQPERSILEAVFARGDRRLGRVLYEAWRRGARLDGWDEVFDNRRWLDAYAATGIDPDFYAHRERSYGELLPWDHIRARLPRRFLERGYDDIFAQLERDKPPPGINAIPHP